jgi:hypothetical protein
MFFAVALRPTGFEVGWKKLHVPRCYARFSALIANPMASYAFQIFANAAISRAVVAGLCGLMAAACL